jgi:cytochrome c oxidase subunit IV
LLLGRLGGSFHAFGAVQVQFFLSGSYRLVSLVALGLLAATGRLLGGLRCSLLVTLFSLRAGILFTRFAVFTRLAFTTLTRLALRLFTAFGTFRTLGAFGRSTRSGRS